MMCPHCGYAMGAFDQECPRCHGRGIPKTQPLAPTAPPVQHGSQPGAWPTAGAPVAPPFHDPLVPTQGQSFCSGCGTPSVGAAFCSHCGQPAARPLGAIAPSAVSGQWVTPPPPSAYPIQNNVTVVVAQQNDNKTVVQNNNSGWWAALLLLVFGTPLGCIAIPVTLILIVAASQFAPLIIAAIVAVSIAVTLGKSTLTPDKKIIAIVSALVIGACFAVLFKQLF